jgi:phosphopantetheine--protein transferase-like protein
MVGSSGFDAALAYVSRLVGEDVTLDQPLVLRSIHRVALAAWARQENLAIRGGLINSGVPFSIRALMSAGDDAAASPVVHVSPATGPEAAGQSGIGIDIEDVASLPVTDDYREHPFFRDNFTPAEIAYCVRQPDARASLCGTWAAKEAVLKAGVPHASFTRLIEIEITHDDFGRPHHAGCTISISHTGQTAVAVCLRQTTPTMAQAARISTAPQIEPVALPVSTVRKKRFALVGAVVVLIAVGLGIYWIKRGIA